MLRGAWEWLSGRGDRGRRRDPARLEAEAQALPADKVFDLVFLHERGYVEARATGHSITRLFGEVQNRVGRRLRVRVPPGTCFIAEGAHQNMATRLPCRLTLDPHEKQSMAIEATCLDAARPIPHEADRFSGVRLAAPDVVRFLEAAVRADAMTAQAGVWALTDRYTEADVQRRLVQTDRYGRRLPAARPDQVDEARRLLSELGIAHRL